MNVKLGLIADYANVSQEGKLNVMGIFSRILAQSYPVTHPVMHLVLVFEANASEKGMSKEVQVRLLNDDGGAVLEFKGNFTVPNSPGPLVEMQQVFALQMLQFQKPGAYAFHVLVGGETRATIPLVVEPPPPMGL